MSKIIMILSTIFLLSASNCTQTDKKIICKQINNNKFKAMPLCDVSYLKGDDGLWFWQCRCRCFNFTDYKITQDNKCEWEHFSPFKSGQYPLLYCNGIIGFRDTNWAKEIRPKVKKASNLYHNLCD